jgi:hypothetical protein
VRDIFQVALSPQRLKPILKRRFIAAVNRCASQKQVQHRVFDGLLKRSWMWWLRKLCHHIQFWSSERGCYCSGFNAWQES